jgi:hypothetical protein
VDSRFRYQLDAEAIGELRMAINQSQPLGNERFYARIERMTGQRREAKPRGRPRLVEPTNDAPLPAQGSWGCDRETCEPGRFLLARLAEGLTIELVSVQNNVQNMIHFLLGSFA